MTDEQLAELAGLIRNMNHLQALAVQLGMMPYDGDLTEEKAISDAAHQMLTSWLIAQADRNTAHRKLVEALKKTDMVWGITWIVPAEPQLNLTTTKCMPGTNYSLLFIFRIKT